MIRISKIALLRVPDRPECCVAAFGDIATNQLDVDLIIPVHPRRQLSNDISP
jgi:hypothetical protein